jgi:sec-independent protein translocase protein TatC
MIGLFYAAVGVSMLVDRRRARHQPEWANLEDDEASAL